MSTGNDEVRKGGRRSQVRSNSLKRNTRSTRTLAALIVALLQLAWMSGAGASTPGSLHATRDALSWAGGAVTLSTNGEPAGERCDVTVTPTAIISTSKWICGPGVHRVTAQLPSNYSAKYIHYRFTLMPGDVTSDVTVMPADFGSGLRIETQPSNAAISADGSAADGTTTLRAKASGRSDTVQWYSATVAGHWSPVKGATRRTLVVSAAAMSAFDVQYVATFTHGEASATSRPASVYEITYGQRWSGYVDVAGGARRFDAVSGTWRVPATTCSAATSYQADWVGIDGQSNNTTEQAGNEENCYHGSASYVAFYYLWGYANFHRGVPVLLPSSSDPIAPHDKLSVSVSLVKEEWTFTFDDATAGWKATIPVAQRNPPPEQASAEWIVEAPQICATNCVTAALAATASVTFTKARATLSGVTGTINSWPTQGFDIAKGFKALNAVSPLNSAGTSFTVTPTRGSG